MGSIQDYSTGCTPNWCPGCGDFAIWAAFKKAAAAQDWNNTNSAIVAGIGCHGHIVNFLKMNSFEGLHGRALPAASGLKMANHKLNVFVFTGDGDCFGEGGNHFMHAARRNHDITVMLHDNSIYALTTGQTSPASPHGMKTKSTPDGNLDNPVNPMALAIAAGATFVARAYTSDIPFLTNLMIEAHKHHGFAIIDILQPCVTFNHVNTHEFYQKNVYYLPKEYDPTDKHAALKKIEEWENGRIPLGVFYKAEKETYEDQIDQIKVQSLIEKGCSKKDLSEVFTNFS